MTIENRFGRQHWSINDQGEKQEIPEPPSFKIDTERLRAETEQSETKDFLKEIKFDVLKKIFEEEYRRAGAPISAMNFVEAAHVNSQTSFFTAGSHDPVSNLVGMDMTTWTNWAKKNGWDKKITFLLGLCHEETHAVAKNDVYHDAALREPYADLGYRKDIKGMAESYFGSGPYPAIVKKVFEDFNEGVTDKIGLEIMLKYASQTGYADEKSIEQFVVNFRQNSPYAKGQHMVEVFINKLSESSGLSKDTVWEAVKSGAISGDNLYSGELREFLDEELGTEYMKRLETGSILKTEPKEKSAIKQRLRNAKALILRLQRKLQGK